MNKLILTGSKIRKEITIFLIKLLDKTTKAFAITCKSSNTSFEILSLINDRIRSLYESKNWS